MRFCQWQFGINLNQYLVQINAQLVKNQAIFHQHQAILNSSCLINFEDLYYGIIKVILEFDI